MAVAVINLTLQRGTDFDAKFKIFKPDSSNYTFPQSYSGVAKVGKYPSSPNKHNFNVNIITSTGEIVIFMDKNTTNLLELGRNYYDILITGPAQSPTGIGITFLTKKVVEGSIIVTDTASL
jgi:hypothetical protein